MVHKNVNHAALRHQYNSFACSHMAELAELVVHTKFPFHSVKLPPPNYNLHLLNLLLQFIGSLVCELLQKILGCNSYAKTQYKMYWISMQSVANSFVCCKFVPSVCNIHTKVINLNLQLFIICY